MTGILMVILLVLMMRIVWRVQGNLANFF